MQGHGIPLPYLQSPALTFLIHITPRGYLSALRYLRESTMVPSLEDYFDIPSTSLRSFLFSHISNHRALYSTSCSCHIPTSFTAGTLHLSSNKKVLDTSSADILSTPSPRPTYPTLHSDAPSILAKHIFPTRDHCEWVLDFADDPTRPIFLSTKGSSQKGGVLMRQSAMREIGRIVGLGTDKGDMDDDLGIPGLGSGLGSLGGSGLGVTRGPSWFDRLVGDCLLLVVI